MKQITKTQQVVDRLRASFGADADIDGLAVFEVIALNTKPLRKTGGIFKGARASLSLLSEMAASINKESVPLRIEHSDVGTPFGRAFYAEASGDELRALIAVDGKNHPEIVAKLESGVVDQVSVGISPKRLSCSGCGFDFLAPEAGYARFMLECDEGHTIGDGFFVHMDGLDAFLELSLVGKGAGDGARVVGPADALLQQDQFQRLAASAAQRGFAALRLTAAPEEDRPNMDLLARVEALSADKATATAQLNAANETIAQRDATIVELNARVEELKAHEANAGLVAEANEKVAAAVTALKDEATTILTALGKPSDNLPEDVTALLALINEHRAAFAAIVPVDGKSKPADTSVKAAATVPVAAFRTRA